MHVIYVNTVGGQDDVVFDGDSMLAAPDGSIVARGAQFAADLVVVDIDAGAADIPGALVAGHPGPVPPLAPRPADGRLDEVAEVWAALVTATRDYCHHNGFDDVIVALSGGIDSALTAAIAADALGGQHVVAVLLPSPYSSDHSLADALELADTMAIRTHTIPIQAGMSAIDAMLADAMAAEATGVVAGDGSVSLAEENIQSRLRGLVTMALSNATGALVLTTGNKSEYAVGYATLYGDMAGAFAPLKDVPKTLAYELARHRNSVSPAIPVNTIDQAALGRTQARAGRPGLAAALRRAGRHHRRLCRRRPRDRRDRHPRS